MPRFMVVHTLPLTEQEWLQATSSIAEQVPEDVQWKRTYCDFSDQKFFCEWEAPNKEMLEQGFQATETPFDDIFPVRLFDPAKNEMEPEEGQA